MPAGNRFETMSHYRCIARMPKPATFYPWRMLVWLVWLQGNGTSSGGAAQSVAGSSEASQKNPVASRSAASPAASGAGMSSGAKPGTTTSSASGAAARSAVASPDAAAYTPSPSDIVLPTVMASRHKWVHDEGSCLADYDFDIDDSSSRLGEGASGVVVVGCSRRDGKQVAIKVMVKDKLSDEDIAAVAVEVDAMNKVKGHPHCVELYDMYDEPTAFYLAIELVRGGELFTQLASGEPYFEAQAREAMHQMVSAIEWCHRSGVVHRDLKVSQLPGRLPAPPASSAACCSDRNARVHNVVPACLPARSRRTSC